MTKLLLLGIFLFSVMCLKAQTSGYYKEAPNLWPSIRRMVWSKSPASELGKYGCAIQERGTRRR